MTRVMRASDVLCSSVDSALQSSMEIAVFAALLATVLVVDPAREY